ncbi:DUF1345 domain-containing protein [Sphingomonas morindae]|uniref:DUF1345 domain-containing protein n=1 Tax=Sphingomonas morindae TaxID=1541170 RepID=A0ABY4XB97_9SPHN|nr:DUF1345 domain-containing protein [Sphingomonas morindae]USI74144.1 DUF1345 domain-containing protein [Sphingomonas morindae]
MASPSSLGNRIAPARFLVFFAQLVVLAPLLTPWMGGRHAVMAAFDASAALFLLSLWPLFRDGRPKGMRAHAAANDANRALLLAITVSVTLVILIAIGSELADRHGLRPATITLLIATLACAWLFANTVYALHYAHIYYSQGDTDGDGSEEDLGGLDFPKTQEPGYWDFLYFAFTLGMTFQTSDTQLTTTKMRIVVVFHCLAAFVFNLGVVAFTVNVLGSS